MSGLWSLANDLVKGQFPSLVSLTVDVWISDWMKQLDDEDEEREIVEKLMNLT